ncbi:hypothetical protein GOODEAATRI_032343 [Goodea atripinnis]|uniref:Uncharacterized protein n=1 Tax=Goodea atripinnis TaxID=208336 RepID=A0ABV0NQ91_9TELE
MSRSVRERIHGTQKHPHVTRIPKIQTMNSAMRYLPKVLVNHFSSPPPIPEYSCISLVRKPSNARVTEPSGAELEHVSPNIAHTPPFQPTTCPEPIYSVQP